ncbi:MAG: hypothetical protein U9R25_17230 [Chloroflexota bacterium]|nr:hypothetical protein [Chloroflexota bacterium]
MLKAERNISFEEVVFHIGKRRVLDIVEHPNQEKYKDQKIFVINIDDYACLVPFVEGERVIFLITTVPSRRATRKYLKGRLKMSEIKLDAEEKELLASYEADEWQSVGNVVEEVKAYSEYATATFRKDRRVNIRISSKDLEALQKRALEEGLPYQTLIASVLHKFISGRLVDRR